MYSPWCCFMISKKVFCMKTMSVGRLFAAGQRVLLDLASSWSRGTTLLTKLHSYISSAVNGRPVKTISWNLRRPIIMAHCHMRGA